MTPLDWETQGARADTGRSRPGGIVAVALCAVLLATLAGCATAPAEAPVEDLESSEVVQVEELGEGDQDAGLHLELDGPVQVNFREITLPPGTTTGVHCHHGNLIAVVESGTLTHYAPVYPGGVREYAAGDSIFEGAGYRHEGRNEGDTDVVLLVTYLTPEGEPLAETDLERCDTP